MMRTSLYNVHLESGGRMVDFAGWELPVMYTSILEEHTATRTGAGLFDVSHMGEITLRGKDAAGLLSKLIPTRLDRLEEGASMYSCFCNEKGGVVDDIFVFKKNADEYYLVVNASTKDKDLSWIKNHSEGGVEVVDESEATSKIDLQGPLSREILKKVIGDPKIEECRRFHFFTSSFQGKPLMISQTGYTGELGYELFIENEMAAALWKALVATGGAFGLKPAGLGARDTLRMESCYSLYGHELGEDISPVEAGLKWLVSSEAPFIGRNTVFEQKTKGAPREMICFELTGKGIPRENCRVMKEGNAVGRSTSGGYSPTFRKGIGMALVQRGSLTPGEDFTIEIRGAQVAARVVTRPIYKYNG